jgi:hypothetical protein
MQFDRDTNFYAILQVDEAASGSVIRAAHQVLLELYIDDKPRRALVEEAYKVLSHPTQRKQYDAFRDGVRGRGDEEQPEITVLCPVCESANVLNPLKDNRAAACGICRAKLAKDLIGKPIRKQAKKNMLAIFKKRYAGMSKQYRSSLVFGLIFLTIAVIGTGTFFGFRSQWNLNNVRIEMRQPGQISGQQGAVAQAPQGPVVPVSPGQRQADALASIKRDGWAVGQRYDVTGPSGKQVVVEASKAGAGGIRMYFEGGRLKSMEGM